MDFKATHLFQGREYMTCFTTPNFKTFCFGNKPIVLSEAKVFWLFSEETWENDQEAEFAVGFADQFISDVNLEPTKHKIDEIEVISELTSPIS